MKLIEGQVYTFKRLRGNRDANHEPQIIKKRMRLVKNTRITHSLKISLESGSAIGISTYRKC